MVPWFSSLVKETQLGPLNYLLALNLYPISQLNAIRESHINTEIAVSVNYQSLNLNDAH